MIKCILLSYLTIFGNDYSKAVEFNSRNHQAFASKARLYKTDVRILKAVVFPELIRYSLLRDLIETRALEHLYANGVAEVDFSIGHFQMKPSFAEQIEKYITDHGLKGFGQLITYKSLNHRRERISRLKSLEWQLSYLCGFIKVFEHRFSSVSFSSEAEKLRFLFTAYNSGFLQMEQHLRKRLSEKFFPYGPKMQVRQYNYADIALEYYLTH
jgi:hypothetical protein